MFGFGVSDTVKGKHFLRSGGDDAGNGGEGTWAVY